MNIALRVLSLLTLAATIGPACVFLAGMLELAAMKVAMLAATIVWFAVTPWWMK